MDGVNIDLYDELSKMIDCDMRTDFDGVDLTPLSAADLGECLNTNDSGQVSATDQQVSISSVSSNLGEAHTPPSSSGDYQPMDSEMVNDSGIAWFQNNPQLYTVNNSDFEQTGGGLMVNPQTGIPITSQQISDASLSASLSPSNVVTTVTNSSVFMSTPPHDGMQHVISTNVNHRGHIQHHLTDTSVHHRNMQVQQHRLKNSASHKKSNKEVVRDPQEKVYPKPTYSYSCLIAMALKNSRTGSLPVSEIYNFMTENFPYFKTAPNGWKNSVRHNLSLNKCFEKIEKPGSGSQRKGCLWAMNPAKIVKMDEEVQKWKRKDPVAIRQSMANPDILERLERGEVKSSSPVTEEMTADSTTEGGLSPDTTPADGGRDIEYHIKTEENIPPLPDLVIQNGFWEELSNTNLGIGQGIAIKNEVSTTHAHHLERMLTHSSNIISSSSSSPHHSLVSSSTTDLQGNYAYTNLQPMTVEDNTNHQVVKQEADTWSRDNVDQSKQESIVKQEVDCENENVLNSQESMMFHQTAPKTVSALI